MSQTIAIDPPGAEPAESAKRCQILAGAKRVFLTHGFDAASMGQIARAAGVSKGTLYVYFDSKDALFTALILERKRTIAEQLLVLDHANPDVAAELDGLARRFMAKLTAPEHVALLRAVIGAAEKFPELGRAFYDSGPAYGAGRLAEYLAEQHARGTLDVPDPRCRPGSSWACATIPRCCRSCWASPRHPTRVRSRNMPAPPCAPFWPRTGPRT